MFESVVRSLADQRSDFCVGLFASSQVRKMAADALTETGRWHKRNRCLPALVVLWLVVMLALHRSASIPDVFLRIRAAAKARWGDQADFDVTDEALVHARARLGLDPLVVLFHKTARDLSVLPTFAGFRVWVLDGTSCDVPDTPQNEAKWGRPGASRGRAAFPQLKIVLLVSASTRLVKDFVVLPCTESETKALPSLLNHLGPGDLLFVDRGFASYELLKLCRDRGIHLVMRVQSGYKPRQTQRFGVGDFMVEGTYSERIPEAERTGKRKTRDITVTARLVMFWFRRHQQPVRLLTTLPQEIPARWIAEGYHERWEVELVIDELKTHMASVLHGTLHTTFRGKSPATVLQEVYGLMIAYNLIRQAMLDAALQHDLNPLHISFVGTLEVIRTSAPYLLLQPLSEWPRLRTQLLKDIAERKIRQPRRKKLYPRAVKRKMSNFKLKPAEARGEDCDFRKEVELQDPEPSTFAA